MWRKYLLKYHLLIVILIFTMKIIIKMEYEVSGVRIYIVGIVILIAIISFLFIYPQIMYKSQNRDIKINNLGITTKIGKINGQVNCKEVLEISDINDSIIITGKNLNSFIIPSRVFTINEDREKFLTTIQKWHKDSNS